MSVEATRRVWKFSEQGGSNLLAMLALADWADEYDWAWPSYKTLADKIRMSRMSAIRLTTDLADAGELYIYPRPYRSNQYLIAVGMNAAELRRSFLGKRGKGEIQMSEKEIEEAIDQILKARQDDPPSDSEDPAEDESSNNLLPDEESGNNLKPGSNKMLPDASNKLLPSSNNCVTQIHQGSNQLDTTNEREKARARDPLNFDLSVNPIPSLSHARSGKTDGTLQAKKRGRVTSDMFDPRKIAADGLIPLGKGETPIEIHRECFDWREQGQNLSTFNCKLIVDAVTDLDRWRLVCQAWSGAGNRGSNRKGLLDWYYGEIPAKDQPEPRRAQPAAQSTFVPSLMSFD